MRLLTLAFLFVWAVSLKAQVNLVPNPSFEEYNNCPSNLSQVETSLLGWWESKGSPDYFNTCGDQAVSIPNNVFGYQNITNGYAYAGFWAYASFENTARECISTELSEPMIIGKPYLFSMKVNRTNLESNSSCNKLGVIFSTEHFNSNNVIPINNWAHIYSDSLITDTLNWITIEGSFISDESYIYINIGNFFDNNHTDILMDTIGTTNYYGSYYYLDDVSVTLDTTTAIPETEKPKLKIFPNPAGNQITVEQLSVTGNQLSVEVYDWVGRLVSQSVVQGQTSTIPLNLSKGVYLLRVKEKEEVVFWEKLIIE